MGLNFKFDNLYATPETTLGTKQMFDNCYMASSHNPHPSSLVESETINKLPT